MGAYVFQCFGVAWRSELTFPNVLTDCSDNLTDEVFQNKYKRMRAISLHYRH